ncbi:helix-turn-helix domain-containing protein [Myroides odoratus]|uniref:helix-turn-helix domain-containing protein n=1 Tax=Myroides odoratus TaxID=256 RepID=UPI0039B08610
MSKDFTLYIKNMVCPRCIVLVNTVLVQLEVRVEGVQLGEVQLLSPLSIAKKRQIEERFLPLGFEVLEDPRLVVVEQVKIKIIEYVQTEKVLRMNLSDYLATTTSLNYAQLAKLFVGYTSLTIEKFYLLQRIEKVKELISYGELSLEEIAQKLHYKEASHMSKQFKKIVGISPSMYKKNQKYERKFLDDIIT